MTVKELIEELEKVVANGYGDYQVDIHSETGYGTVDFTADNCDVDERLHTLTLAEDW